MRKNITPISLSAHVENAMRRYGSYVATERAVADVRDGLKPVQRRIIWSMNDLHMVPTGNFHKSAKTVGHTIGNYHPHSEAAIYGTLVNLVNDHYPLINGHGNFGGPLDNAASSRYTECRLSPLAMSLIEDKDVGQYVPNYSDDKNEPLVLPSRVPMLLLNGSSGIGVGLASNLPPHNLEEVIHAIIHQIRTPNCRLDTLLQHLHGPDYGYGVLCSSDEDILDLYRTGKGTLKYRCSFHFEEAEDHQMLVVTSLAPGFNLASFLTKMKQLQDDDLIEYCSDTSCEDKLKIVVGFKDAYTVKERVLPELYTSDSYQFYVVKRDGKETLNDQTLFLADLKTLIQEFIDFRRIVENDRLNNELVKETKLLEKAEAILLGIKSLSVVYDVLRIKHTSIDDLSKALSIALHCTIEQANYILDLKVQALARIHEDTQCSKIVEIKEKIENIKKDLSDIDSVIIRNLKELLKFKDKRGTLIRQDAEEITIDTSTKWVVAKGKKVIRYDNIPKSADLVAQCSEYAIIVLENNTVNIVRPHYFSELKYKDNVIAVLSDACTKLVALDDRGLFVVIELPQKKDKYQLIKGAVKIVSAVGLCLGDTLSVKTTDGNATLSYDELVGTRPFVAGKKLVKNAVGLST